MGTKSAGLPLAFGGMKIKPLTHIVPKLLTVLIVVAATPGTHAADLYASNASEFKAALAAARPGDTVIVRPGTYTDSDSTWEEGFNPARSGNPTAPITIKSEVPLAAVVTAPNDNVVALGIFSRQYIVVDGFKSQGMLKMHNSQFITIKNCEVLRGGIENGDVSLHWGLIVHSSSDSTVANNLVHNMQPGLGNGLHNSAAIMVGFGSHRNIVENNEADAGHGAVFSAFGQKGGNLTFNTWRRNIARNARAGFLGMGSTNGDRYSTDNTYYQNIVIDTEEAFRLDHNAQRWTVYNNTVYNVTAFMHDIRGGTLPTTNTGFRIWNNLIYQAETAYDIDGADDPTFDQFLTESDYNLFHNVTRMGMWNWGSGSLGSLSSWSGATVFDDYSLNSDPLFVNAAGGSFQLQAGSPAKGRGRGGMDIGAYPTGTEVIGVSRLPRPRAPTFTVR